ncbi:DUF4382 domain-containing protein [Psychroserpens sp.]|uniref:DUF4382 domain-containing protein n=1 Tax=Psychroserpens sp. TaxID=2020870 RepID=UPI001B157A05|nr:DUF4382 domain-containing protein [Psychroserpens sp.]MBO6607690.1 DUF4382 domain-containing protein [Psychroserpens sp.]MBO6630099.1 DUF4382 domain-containing protein [Psychroserpens sp.]MBO6654681.1 DUF4382 domain-containing protein [Psychroserpens sp.]MBO6682895.1 DUF4382 domain-containing protein [Psychroserpens sp.]MBO6751048.1 DUF4382 domain-containing protein [Psychroserpens sp.]
MKLITSAKPIILLFLVLGLFSCSKEYETETFPDSALVTIKLQGLQSQLSSVNIEVTDIQFQLKADATEADAWLSLNTVNMGVHDLTRITGDQVVTLVDFDEVDLNHIYNMKLVYGENNSMVKQGLNYDLVIAPELDNASVNMVDRTLEANKIYEFIVEFDLDESITIENGIAQLRPQTSTILRRFEIF